MPLKQELTKFTTASPKLATFPSEEIASGLSAVEFIGVASNVEGTIAYNLIGNPDSYSVPIGTSQSGAGTTEINFDTGPFELTRTAKGTAYFSCGLNGSSNPSTSTGKVTVQLIHVAPDTTETTISDEITSQTFTTNSAEGINAFLPIPITQKHFAKGDKLRLEVKLILVSGVTRVDIGHDPKNSDFQAIAPSSNDTTTVMKLIMSFRSEE